MPAFPLSDLPEGATKTASFTAVANVLYPIDLSGASGDFVVTFPTGVTGNLVGWYVKTPHASCTYGCEPLSSTSIRGGTSHDNTYSLFQLGEMIIFRYDGATWQVRYDGRIPFSCHVELSADTTGETAGTFTAIGFNSEVYDNGSFYDAATNKKATTKRRNKYRLEQFATAVSNVADGNYYAAGVGNALPPTVTYAEGDYMRMGAADATIQHASNETQVMAVGTIFQPWFISGEGSRGVDASFSLGRKSYFKATEVLE